MSFFLVEVSLLNIRDNQFIENVVKLISSSGFEEERDGESSNDSSKEVDLIVHQIPSHNISLILIFSKINRIPEDHYPHSNYSFIFSPPPDFTDAS